MIGQNMLQTSNFLLLPTKSMVARGNQSGFPLGLEKWEGIFQSWKSQGILNRLEKSGKSHKILDNSEFQTNSCYFLVIAK